jgi:hypothetical protein
MKNLPGTIKYGLAAAGVVVIVACATVMPNQRAGLRFHRNGIPPHAEIGVEILPGANLSKDQNDALMATLAHYPKSMYKIQKYQNAKLRRTIGTLNEQKYMMTTVAEVATMAKNIGFTGYSVCAGDCKNNSSTAKVPAVDAKLEELVRKLKPILEPPQSQQR